MTGECVNLHITLIMGTLFQETRSQVDRVQSPSRLQLNWSWRVHVYLSGKRIAFLPDEMTYTVHTITGDEAIAFG